MAAIVVSVYFVFALYPNSLFFPVWQATLVPELTCFLIFLAGLVPRSDMGERVSIVIIVAAVALFSQVHLVFLFLAPAIAIVYRRYGIKLYIMIPAVFFALWDWVSRDSLATNIDIAFNRFDTSALLGEQLVTYPFESHMLFLLAFVAVAIIGRWITRWCGISKEKLEPDAERFAHVGLIVYSAVCLIVLGSRLLTLRYWVPAVVLALLSLAGLAHRLYLRRSGQEAWSSWFGAFALAVACIVVADRGRTESSRLTVDEIHRIGAGLASLGLDVNDAFYSVTPATSISRDFYAGIWLNASCMIHKPRLGSSRVASKYLLFPVPKDRRLDAQAGNIRRFTMADRSFFMLKYHPYVETRTFKVCRGQKGQECHKADLSFRNPGQGKQCFSGKWPHVALWGLGKAVNIEIEYKVHVPAAAVDHILYLPRFDRMNGSDNCRGRIVTISGILFEKGHNQVLIRGTAEHQDGFIRIRWPWREEQCGVLSEEYPQPIVELEKHIFDKVSMYIGPVGPYPHR